MIIRPVVRPVVCPVASQCNVGGGGPAPPVSKACLTFDGTNDYVDFGDDDVFSFTNGSADTAFTVAFWAYLDDLVGVQALVSKWDTGSREWLCYLSSSTLYFELYGPASSAIRSQVAFPSTATWVHVTLTYNGLEDESGVEIWLDGVASGLGTASGAYTGQVNGTAPLRLGRYDTGNYLAGRIYDLRIYSKELTTNEIEYVKEEGASGDDPGTDDLVGLWKLNEGSGSTVEDDSVNANDGTLTNFDLGAAWANEFTG